MVLDETDLIIRVRSDSVQETRLISGSENRFPDTIDLTATISRHPRTKGKKRISIGTKRQRLERYDKLINLIARAHQWSKDLRSGKFKTTTELAAHHGVDNADFGKQVRLVYLAPDIVADFMKGRHPPSLTANFLWRLSDLPADWGEQRKLLGFC